MNIRSLYLSSDCFLSLALLYEWNSEQKTKSIKQHLDMVGSSSYKDDSRFVSIENDELSLVVSISNGSIVEARLKKYPVENVNGSLGFRVFGSSEVFVRFNIILRVGLPESHQFMRFQRGAMILSFY